MPKELRDKNGLTEEEFLRRYDANKYPRPSVTADIAAFRHRGGRTSVLLIKRGGHPFIGTWALPGGFVEPRETAENAARRELVEETGIEDAPVRQMRTFSAPDRDPRTRVITVAFYSCLDGKGDDARAGDDAADACWFDIESSVCVRDGAEVTDFTLTGAETLEFSVCSRPAEYGFDGDTEYVPLGDRVLASDHEAIFALAYETDRRFCGRK